MDLPPARDATGARWYVLQTGAREEKALILELEAMGIRHDWPTVRRSRSFGRRNAWVDVPLIHGFVFILAVLEHLFLACETGHVEQIVQANQQLLERELGMLQRALATAPERVESHPFPGLRLVAANLVCGDLRGLEGRVDPRRPDRLILPITAARQAVSLALDGCDIWRPDACETSDRHLGKPEIREALKEPVAASNPIAIETVGTGTRPAPMLAGRQWKSGEV